MAEKLDWKNAEDLYNYVRSQDTRLSEIEKKASEYLYKFTDYLPANIGSFGLRLNLPDSDLDLAIGVPDHDRERVLLILKEKMYYKTERVTRKNTTRHVFEMQIDNISIDVGVMRRDDWELLVSGLKVCVDTMSKDERVKHLWEKFQLKKEGKSEEYAKFKLAPYQKFCPDFVWVPIL